MKARPVRARRLRPGWARTVNGLRPGPVRSPSQDLAPADALRAAQLWMLDPDRRPPPGLGDPLRREAARTGLHEIHLWAAFTHQGNPAPR